MKICSAISVSITTIDEIGNPSLDVTWLPENTTTLVYLKCIVSPIFSEKFTFFLSLYAYK